MHCVSCNIQFENDISLTIHNFRKHGKLIPVFKCGVCRKLFPNKTTLQAHKLKLHQQIQKHSNDIMESKQGDDEESDQKMIKDDRKEHKCEICSKLFDIKELLENHLRSDHKNDLDAQQKIPDKKMSSAKESQCAKVKPKCDKCLITFSTKANLKRHLSNLSIIHEEKKNP